MCVPGCAGARRGRRGGKKRNAGEGCICKTPGLKHYRGWHSGDPCFVLRADALRWNMQATLLQRKPQADGRIQLQMLFLHTLCCLCRLRLRICWLTLALPRPMLFRGRTSLYLPRMAPWRLLFCLAMHCAEIWMAPQRLLFCLASVALSTAPRHASHIGASRRHVPSQSMPTSVSTRLADGILPRVLQLVNSRVIGVNGYRRAVVYPSSDPASQPIINQRTQTEPSDAVCHMPQAGCTQNQATPPVPRRTTGAGERVALP